jgi:hypothetical protein
MENSTFDCECLRAEGHLYCNVSLLQRNDPGYYKIGAQRGGGVHMALLTK